jgi:predicted transcriptional regulator
LHEVISFFRETDIVRLQMTRTLINLDPEDKLWLDRLARTRHVPMTALVREAVHEYRVRLESREHPGLVEALSRTAGIGQTGDGLARQDRLRREWNRSN